MSDETNGVFGVEVVDCGSLVVVVASPGLGPLDAGGGIVCGVDVTMALSLGVETDNGRLLANC